MCVSELISSPFLSTFPVLLDQPDLLDALRVYYFHLVSFMTFINNVTRLTFNYSLLLPVISELSIILFL